MVTGTLFWVGPNNSFPVVELVILGALVVLTVPLVIRTRRRRRSSRARAMRSHPNPWEAW